MSIDFNNADQQRQGTSQPIPPKSKVWVSLEITYPSSSMACASDPALTRSSGNLSYLKTTMTVATGEFAGKKIYHNFNIAGAQKENEKTACKISMSQIRAAIEVARGVKPSDAGPQATQARILNSWQDLQGLKFPIEVGCEFSRPSKDGRIYVNNRMERVITLEDPDYKTLYEAGEIISNEPIPVPEAGGSTQGSQSRQDEWGANQQSYSQPIDNSQQLAPTQKPDNGMPPWAQKPPQPSESIDRTPF